MEVINRRCAGLDVHEKFVVACRRLMGADGGVQKVVQTFPTMTADLLALADWLADAGVTHVAMESTGVFWKPTGTSSKAGSRCCWSTRATSSRCRDARPMSPTPSGSRNCCNTACCGPASSCPPRSANCGI